MLQASEDSQIANADRGIIRQQGSHHIGWRGAQAGRQAPPTRGLQQLHLHIIMSRADVLPIPRPAPRRTDDLHRRRARGGLHRPQIRGHQPTVRLRLVRNFSNHEQRTPQVTGLRPRRPDRGRSQVKKFVRTARHYRSITIQAGPHTIIAADPVSDDLHSALTKVNNTSRDAH